MNRDSENAFLIENTGPSGQPEGLLGICASHGRMLLVDKVRIEADWRNTLEREKSPA